MTVINLPSIASQISSAIPADASVTFEASQSPNGALHVRADGPCAATSICLWQSGHCEVTRVMTESGMATVQEHQFTTAPEAADSITAQVLEALSLANRQDAP